jgi:hypothetical protein
MEICGGAVKEDNGEGIKMWKVIRERSDGSPRAAPERAPFFRIFLNQFWHRNLTFQVPFCRKILYFG